MKFNVEKKEMLRGLEMVMMGMVKKSDVAILHNIRITADSGCLVLRSTDREIGITTRVTGDVVNEGDVTVPFKQIYKVVKQLPAGKFEVEQDGHVLRIISGKMKYGLDITDVKDFMDIPVTKNKTIFTITGKALKALLVKTVFAVSDDETRYVLNGVRVELCKGHVRIVATDGRRMVVFQKSGKDYSYKQEKKMDFILPEKAVKSIIKMISIYGGTVSFKHGKLDNEVFFTTGNTIIRALVIVGEYPKYRHIVDKAKENEIKISLHRMVLVEAIKKIEIGNNPGHGCKFTFNKGILTLSAKTTDMGEISNEIGVAYTDSLILGYSSEIILQALRTLNTEHVTFAVGGMRDAMLITGYENKENIYHVVMPYRVDR